MPQVTSKDGTTIVYDRIGQGPAVVIVGGVLGDRSQQAGLARLLAEHFTVLSLLHSVAAGLPTAETGPQVTG